MAAVEMEKSTSLPDNALKGAMRGLTGVEVREGKRNPGWLLGLGLDPMSGWLEE